MMEKVLSVIIPTYNMEKYLDRCLTSLVMDDADAMEKLEVLVINDGSKDRSSEIAHSYETRYPHTFRVVDKENGNYGSCINRGLKEATGKYVKVLDADDYFETENLPGYVLFLSHSSSDLVITQTRDHVGEKIRDNLFSEIPYEEPISLGQLEENTIKHIYMHSITYRTEIPRSIGYSQLEGISYTDNQWAIEPMAAVSTVECYHHIIYNYIIGREGQTVSSAIHSANICMEERVALECLTFYERVKPHLTGEERNFLKTRIRFLIQWLYSFYLVDYRRYLKYQKLNSLDDIFLLISPEIYNDLSDCYLPGYPFKFRYIRFFRKYRCRLIFDLVFFFKIKMSRFN